MNKLTSLPESRKILLSLFYGLAIFYFIFSFCLWEWNPSNWNIVIRILFLLLSNSVIYFYYASKTQEPEPQNESYTLYNRYKELEEMFPKLKRDYDNGITTSLLYKKYKTLYPKGFSRTSFYAHFNSLKKIQQKEQLPPISDKEAAGLNQLITDINKHLKPGRKRRVYKWKKEAKGRVRDKLLKRAPTKYLRKKYPDLVHFTNA